MNRCLRYHEPLFAPNVKHAKTMCSLQRRTRNLCRPLAGNPGVPMSELKMIVLPYLLTTITIGIASVAADRHCCISHP